MIFIFILSLISAYLSYSFVNKIISYNHHKENLLTVKDSTLKVEILNGCGVEGVCDTLTNFLRINKIDVVSTGNYSSFDIDNTIIIDRIGSDINTKRIAELLNVKEENIIQLINKDYLLDVTVIVGKDLYKLVPLNRGLN